MKYDDLSFEIEENGVVVKCDILEVIPNKNNSEETWTGRGKQPRWLVAQLDKGAKLEDFQI